MAGSRRPPPIGLPLGAGGVFADPRLLAASWESPLLALRALLLVLALADAATGRFVVEKNIIQVTSPD
jgi:hypothetical protein